MTFSDLKFSQKLGVGFGLLILISVILGTIAVVNMESTAKKSDSLTNQHVPSVEASNNIERYALLTMYGMRGYGYTGEKQFLDAGENNLSELKKSINEADVLARNSTDLKALVNGIDGTKTKVASYENLIIKISRCK